MSLGGDLPLGAGLNAQWARLTSSHPLLAPVSRPRWLDILRCRPLVRPGFDLTERSHPTFYMWQVECGGRFVRPLGP